MTRSFAPFPRLRKVTHPDGSSMGYGYDTLSGMMNSITDSNGVVQVTNAYDSNFRVESQTHPDTGQYLFNYTVAGGYITQTSMTAPNGGVISMSFNMDAYITSKTTPDGTTNYQRESGSNEVLSKSDPLGRSWTYTYYYNYSTTDYTDGLLKTVTDNLGNTYSYAYEPQYGLLSQITDPLNNLTTMGYTYDASNRITKVVIADPLSHATTINYNTSGTPASITDPNNNTTTFGYDPTYLSELTKITDPLANVSTVLVQREMDFQPI